MPVADARTLVMRSCTTFPLVLTYGGLALGVLVACGCEQRDRAGDATSAAEVGVDRGSASAALEAAEKLFQAQRLEEAHVVAQRLAEKAPSHWPAQEMLGRVLAAQAAQADELGRPAEARGLAAQALDAYRTAAQLAALPADAAPLWLAAGLMADRLGDLEGARAHYARAANLEPGNPQHPLFEAQALLRHAPNDVEALDAAESCLRRVLELRPDEPFAYASLAEIHRRRGDAIQALEAMRTARRLDPENLVFRRGEARLLRLADRPREGLELLLALGEARWSDPAIVDEVAAGWHALGEPAKAAQAWEACHRAHPHQWTAALGAAEAWLDAGDVVRADVWLRDAEQAAPGRAEVIAMRAHVLAAAGIAAHEGSEDSAGAEEGRDKSHDEPHRDVPPEDAGAKEDG